MKQLISPCFLAVGCFVIVGCGLPTVTPMLSAVRFDIEGDIELAAGGGAAQGKADADDLDLDPEETLQGRIDVDWGDLHLSVTGFEADFSGNGTATTTLSLPGQPPISAGTPVASDFEFRYAAATLVYDIIPTLDVIDLGIGLGAGFIDYDIDIQSRVSTARVFADDTLPFGYLTLRGAAEFWRFGAIVHASGLAFEFDDDDLSFFDVDAQLNFKLFGGDERLQGRIIAGYRLLQVDYEFEDGGTKVEADPRLSGPYLGVSFTF